VRAQYPDGLRGAFIVHDPDSPYKGQYDEEIILTFSDWYHSLMKPMVDFFMSRVNPTGAEPVPDAALMNDTQGLKIKIEPGKTYMFRMVNIGGFAGQHVWFEGHTMRIVEVDGVYTEPADAEMIYISAAQRYSVLITARNDTGGNFPVVGSMDQVGICFQLKYVTLLLLGLIRRRSRRPEPECHKLAYLRRFKALPGCSATPGI
jgi:iron transport multicopper oxidase